jgi:hypothetical protein
MTVKSSVLSSQPRSLFICRLYQQSSIDDDREYRFDARFNVSSYRYGWRSSNISRLASFVEVLVSLIDRTDSQTLAGVSYALFSREDPKVPILVVTSWITHMQGPSTPVIQLSCRSSRLSDRSKGLTALCRCSYALISRRDPKADSP